MLKKISATKLLLLSQSLCLPEPWRRRVTSSLRQSIRDGQQQKVMVVNWVWCIRYLYLFRIQQGEMNVCPYAGVGRSSSKTLKCTYSYFYSRLGFSCILTCRPSCLLLSGHSAHRRTQALRRRWGRESSHRGWWAQSWEVGSSRSFSATGCFRWLCLSTGCPGSPGCSTPLLVEEEVIGRRGNKPFSPLCGLENKMCKPKVS